MSVDPYLLTDLMGSPKILSDRARAEITARFPCVPMAEIDRLASIYSMVDQTFRAGRTLGQARASLKKLQNSLKTARNLLDDLEPFAERYITIGTDFPGSILNEPPGKLLDQLIHAVSNAQDNVPLGRRAVPRDWLASALMLLFERENIEICSRPGGTLSRVMAIILEDMNGNVDELRKVIDRAADARKIQRNG